MGSQRNISVAASVAATVAATKAENQPKPLQIQGRIKRLLFGFSDRRKETAALVRVRPASTPFAARQPKDRLPLQSLRLAS